MPHSRRDGFAAYASPLDADQLRHRVDPDLWLDVDDGGVVRELAPLSGEEPSRRSTEAFSHACAAWWAIEGGHVAGRPWGRASAEERGEVEAAVRAALRSGSSCLGDEAALSVLAYVGEKQRRLLTGKG